MRRWFMLLLVGFLVGCGGGSTPTAPAVPTPTVPPTLAPQVAPPATATTTPTSAPTPAPTNTAAATSAPTSASSPAATATATKAPAAANGDLTQLHVGDNGDGYGFNVWGLSSDPAFRDKVYANVQGAGFGWMRQQVQWAAIEPQKGNYGNDTTAQLDQFVSGASAKGLKVLLSVVKSPDWVGAKGGLPTKTQDFTDFMGFLTQRYKGKVEAYEIWNEENYAVETGGTVNVAAYLPVLKAGFQAVKKTDPKAVVVFGGLTPTGVNDPSIALNDVEYLRQIYALNGGEIKQYYDVLGAHPGSNCNPPDNSYPANPQGCDVSGTGKADFSTDDSFYFKRILDLRKVMEDAGEGNTKMWLTEFGWTTANQAKGYEYGAFVSEQQQAQYLVRAFELGKSYPWVGVMFVWNLNFATITPPSDEKYPWAVLKSDWSPRPAYTALKNMPK
ncbi:MAG: cellulase family glycosylhydrolase [Chloroflexota bacterium]|nr:cellulase family glycosylhydrolase [Chloroflexota bacterium]